VGKESEIADPEDRGDREAGSLYKTTGPDSPGPEKRDTPSAFVDRAGGRDQGVLFTSFFMAAVKKLERDTKKETEVKSMGGGGEKWCKKTCGRERGRDASPERNL